MSQADPFHFYTRLHLRELTGLKAKNLTELAAHLETVPGSVVYHHTHHFLQQHQYLSPEPPNDFAYWVTEILQDKKLGERLTSINTCDFKTIRELREKIVSTIKAYLEKSKDLREAPEGEEFHFIKSVSFIFPTPFLASNLQEFTAVLKKITAVNSIYFHMFEARIRLEKGTNDFSFWLEGLGEKELAQKIARLDPYTHTMEGLRGKVIQLAESRLAKAGKG